MLIQHSNRSTASLTHGGETYDTLGDAIFEVSDAVAAELTAFPHWSVYFGEHPKEASGPEATEDQAYAEGFAARAAGAAKNENPYDRRKAAGKAWARGWDEAPDPAKTEPSSTGTGSKA